MTKVQKVFSVGVIGCGLIGNKRASNLGNGGRLIAVADLDLSKAAALAAKYNAHSFSTWQELLKLPELDLVIVSTLHDSLAEITLAAIIAGKHVLVEKPAARNSRELIDLMATAERRGVKIRVGFNHRFHRSLQKAKDLVNSGLLGPLMFVRGRYGHGGRVGYEKEWRANPQLSGGGELLDQGPHLIDLSRWFLGDFDKVQGYAHTYFWNMPVDDNGFMLLRNNKNQSAFLHVSCTEWKNLFSFEIYGELGKIEISGLGGSYGLEKLTYYKMLPEMGPPETICWEYPMMDNSWAVEMQEFYKDILENRSSNPGIKDAYETLRIVEKIYKESGYDHIS
jgi:predicted dehydrogenase